MSVETCMMFIEQIKLHFAACDGTESPRPEDTVYYDQDENGREFSYRWIEITSPLLKLENPMVAGRVKFYRSPQQEIMEINGRYFRRVEIYTGDSELN